MRYDLRNYQLFFIKHFYPYLSFKQKNSQHVKERKLNKTEKQTNENLFHFIHLSLFKSILLDHKQFIKKSNIQKTAKLYMVLRQSTPFTL